MSVLGPDAAPGHARVRPLRQPARHGDDRQGRARSAPRSAAPSSPPGCWTPSPTPSASGWPPWSSATRLTRPCGWARSPASTSGRRCAASLKALEAAGHIAYGDPEHVEVTGADDEARRVHVPGAAVADDARRAEVHEVEAFGPVATLIGYRDTADVIDLAGLGKGSLAGSVVTDDPEFAREVVLGTAPWHGRLLVLDADAAPESTGHGSPLPTLVHGGPGRAGGGEELGGLRGVLPPPAAHRDPGQPAHAPGDTGRWVKGAPRLADGAHPFTKPLATLRIGDTVTGGPRTVTLADIQHFAEFTGDTFYAHTDEEAARQEPVLRRPGRPRLPRRRLRRRPVRAARLRARARELRHRQPPVPHPGQARRRDERDPDLQADQPPVRRLRRGPLGRRDHQPATAPSWPPTTC